MKRVRDFLPTKILGRTVRWHTKHTGHSYCELSQCVDPKCERTDLHGVLLHDPDGCAHAPTIEVLQVENSHWRWFCSCGSKGIRLIYKGDVERLARTHLSTRHSVVTW